MSMHSSGNGIRDSKNLQQCEEQELDTETECESGTRSKANAAQRKRVLTRSTPRQWAKLIAYETANDSEVVSDVIRAVLQELERRLLEGEAVLLPCGCLEPVQPNRKLKNVATGEIGPAPVRLHLRTTQQFRRRYRKSLKKFGYD